MTILQVKNLSFRYRKGFSIDGISFSLKKKDFLGILGVSGSGKTTIIRAVAGLVTDFSGRIFLGFEREKLGISFQQPSFFDELTVKDNLAYFSRISGRHNRNIFEKNYAFLIDFLELRRFEKRPAEKLSGGMKRRLDIAIALINQPEFVILDEPVGELDPILRKKIFVLIDILAKRGCTFMITSHILYDLERVCNKLLVVNDGKQMFFGDSSEFMDKVKQTFKTKIAFSSAEDLNKMKAAFKDSRLVFSANTATMIHKKDNMQIKELFYFLEKESIKVSEVRVSQPSLEDIFVKMVSNEERKE
ncbi:MAG TPA: ABC transporter ATP-binding protein [Candidatus Woesearchaeota archaeon]|nr:ABC transporter ATP-binding protein [Candidatus Woesearchaeota archaeon]